jgi:N-acetylmuramoyl-L-alanine amidase
MNMLRSAFYTVLAAVVLGSATLDLYAQKPAAKNKPFTVVIDAGHGGKDPGAIGKILREKDLNLSVSMLTGKMIKEKYPEVNVVYTRQTDIFLPLQERANIVNRNNADLFICIHTNASSSPAARGAETYVLGTEKMSANLDVAMRENAVIQLEADYQTNYQGFDPRSVDSYIMFELMQNNYMDKSLKYAENVQKQIVGKIPVPNRGVRQAAFWVLLKSACPSVLFEMGFISNPEEERYLAQPDNQAAIARALTDAFTNFYKPVAKPETPAPVIEQPQDTTVTAVPEVAETPVVKYGVQVCASRTPLKANDPQLKGQETKHFHVNGWYKYYIGEYTSEKEAIDRQKELKSIFPGCWVVTIKQ